MDKVVETWSDVDDICASLIADGVSGSGGGGE